MALVSLLHLFPTLVSALVSLFPWHLFPDQVSAVARMRRGAECHRRKRPSSPDAGAGARRTEPHVELLRQ